MRRPLSLVVIGLWVLLGTLAGPMAGAAPGSAPGSDTGSDPGSEIGDTGDTGTWRIVFNEFPPYSFTASDGAPDGFAIDILREIARERGATLEFFWAQNPRDILDTVRLGGIHISPSLAPRRERMHVLSFSEPYDTLTLRFFARSDTAARMGNELRPGMRIGVNAGALPAFVMRGKPEFETVEFPSNEQMLFGVASGEVDAVLYGEKPFLRLLQVLNMQNVFSPVGEPVREIEISIAVDKRRPDLLAEVNAGLADLRATAAFGSIRQKWFGKPESYWTTANVGMLAGGLILALTLVFVLVAAWLRARAKSELLVLAEARGQEQEAFSAALEAKNLALRKTNDEMQQILYVVGHDLNSPLVSISGFASHAKRNLERGKIDQAQVAFERITQNARSMSALLKGLLDIGRIGRTLIEPEDVDLNELVDDLRLIVAGDLEAAGATIVAPPLPVVRADGGLLRRAIQNLAANAIRHGCPRPGMRVEILAESTPLETRIGVRDRGPGLAADMHVRVFALYQRGRDGGPGEGIGLSVVQKIAELHDGRAWVESAPGEGATFWISLSNVLHRERDASTEEAA